VAVSRCHNQRDFAKVVFPIHGNSSGTVLLNQKWYPVPIWSGMETHFQVSPFHSTEKEQNIFSQSGFQRACFRHLTWVYTSQISQFSPRSLVLNPHVCLVTWNTEANFHNHSLVRSRVRGGRFVVWWNISFSSELQNLSRTLPRLSRHWERSKTSIPCQVQMRWTSDG
jgi:hypothetical protein